MEVAQQNKSLLDLVKESQWLEYELVKSGGEITPELEEVFTSVSTHLASKLDAYDFLMEQLEVSESYWKQKSDEFIKQARARKAFRERLKETIKYAMEIKGMNEIQGDSVRYVLSPSKPALEIDEQNLHSDFWKTVHSKVVDKEMIKSAIELGEKVEGVTLRPVFTLRTYAKRKGDK